MYEAMTSSGIKLTLSMESMSIIRTESMKTNASLENDASFPTEVEDLTDSNDPVSFFVRDNVGRRFSGSLGSIRIRDGLKPPPNIPKKFVVLQPGAKIGRDLDLLSIFGELPEGKYELKAAYSSGLFTVISNKVNFSILNSNPVYSKTVQDYLRNDINTVRTVWINKEETGLYVFIMENSQYHPPNLISNRRILKIEQPEKVYPSLLSSPEVETEHLVWFNKHNARIASVNMERLKGVQDVKLPFDELHFLEPSISTEDSRLRFVVASKGDGSTAVLLVSVASSSEVKVEEVCRFSGLIVKHSIIYDEDLRLHLSWALENGEIRYIWHDLEKPIPSKNEPQLLFKNEDSIADLQLSRACEDADGNLQLLLNIVSYASPTKLHSRLIRIETGTELAHSFHELPELLEMRLLETILDLNCKPHFLFLDKKGALWFKSFVDAKPSRVTADEESCPSNIDYPKMVPSSEESRQYGIYLRYIKNKERFVYKKLLSLESRFY